MLVSVAALPARTIYVDDTTGSDVWTGAQPKPEAGDGPVKTIQAAVNQVRPGDVIFLNPGSGPYREEVVIKREHSGTKEAPVTLEGNDCLIDVSTDISAGPWTREGDDWILESPRLAENAPPEKVFRQRAIAFYKGRPVHVADKKVAGYRIATVTVDAGKRFRFRFADTAASPPFTDLRLPQHPTICGVAFVSSFWWHINNLNVRGAGNDGFNLHGRGEGIVIRNSSAMFCGDEGASSHDAMQAEFHDCLFVFNASSVVDINKSLTSYTNCISAFNGEPGFCMTGKNGKYTITDSLSAANRRAEAQSELPLETTTVTNLVKLPKGNGVLEKIRAWKPGHPQMKRLLATVEEVRAMGGGPDIETK